MKIVSAVISDYPAILAINQQVQRVLAAQRPDIFSDQKIASIDKEYFEILLASKSHRVLTAKNQQGPIAYTILQIKRIPSGSVLRERVYLVVQQLAVHEEYQRQGIGTRLIKSIEAIAEQVGASAIELNVFSYNKKALAFYQSLGLGVQSYKLEKRINN